MDMKNPETVEKFLNTEIGQACNLQEKVPHSTEKLQEYAQILGEL
jgi:hypothetical protein